MQNNFDSFIGFVKIVKIRVGKILKEQKMKDECYFPKTECDYFFASGMGVNTVVLLILIVWCQAQ